jgi:hypothetical protein
MDSNPFSTNYPSAWGGQAPDAGAGGFDWASLLQNKAFLSLMSQVGAGISGNNPAVQGVNQLNQQMIGSKSMAGLMQKYLAGQVPGGKIQIDEQGFKLSGPTSALGDLSGPSQLSNAQQGSQLPGGSGTQWNQQNAPQIGRQTNPFVSSQPGELSYADLAGLTPKDVLEAMNVAGDTLYKQGLIENQRAQLNAKQVIDPKDRPFISGVPGFGDMTIRQFDTLPEKSKNYTTYILAARELGEKPMSFREFTATKDKDNLPTTAMGAAIQAYYNETGKLPPTSKLKEWTDLYKEEAGDKEKEPTPLSWGNALSNLQSRYGKHNALGQFVITEGLEDAHDYAMERFQQFQQEGMKPIEAANAARRMTQNYEEASARHSQRVDAAIKQGREDLVKYLEKRFQEEYGARPARSR